MTNLTCKEIADKLNKLETKTPKTEEFEKDCGQKNNRWWDKCDKKDGVSTQKYHVITHFICRYYNGSKFNCSKCPRKCEECYSSDILLNLKPKNNITPENVYMNMKRPEMYLWIIESMELSNEKLDKCIDEIKKVWSNSSIQHNSKMKDVRNILNKYEFNWINIESQLKKL